MRSGDARGSADLVTEAATSGEVRNSDADPREDLPPEFADGTPDRWTLRTMNGGHWPMLTDPATLVAHLVEAASA